MPRVPGKIKPGKIRSKDQKQKIRSRRAEAEDQRQKIKAGEIRSVRSDPKDRKWKDQTPDTHGNTMGRSNITV